MSDEFVCRRCNGNRRLSGPPIPGPEGEEVLAAICVNCWNEWEKAEVMVINELRLDFMDPRSQAVLTQHMKEFLTLAPPRPPFDRNAG